MVVKTTSLLFYIRRKSITLDTELHTCHSHSLIDELSLIKLLKSPPETCPFIEKRVGLEIKSFRFYDNNTRNKGPRMKAREQESSIEVKIKEGVRTRVVTVEHIDNEK